MGIENVLWAAIVMGGLIVTLMVGELISLSWANMLKAVGALICYRTNDVVRYSYVRHSLRSGRWPTKREWRGIWRGYESLSR